MKARRWTLLAAVLAFLPASAAGQTRDCELVRAAKARSISTGTAEIWFVSGPAEFACSDGTEVRADSAVLHEGVLVELIGRVFYADSARTLVAERAIYYMAAARLHAQDNVVLTDRQNNGSVIRSAQLTHERALPERPMARTVATGRPHATLYPRRSSDAADAAPGDTAARPFDIDADWMEISGESRFSATGNVMITRGEARSGAGVATFDQADERLVLRDNAWIEQEDMRLEGRTIEALLSGDELRSVTAADAAHLEGRELAVDAARIHLEFQDGALHRLIAVVPPAPASPAAGDAAERPRAVAHARDLRLIADSIDALAPGQTLREIVAVGDAFAQRQADSLDAALPALVANDWVSGDTINAYFALADSAATAAAAPVAGTPPAADSAAAAAQDSAKVVLERLVVVGPGGRAQALYRVSRERDGAGPPAINYTIADRIVLVLNDGEVQEAEATGDVRGRYLEPQGRSARSTSDTGSGSTQRPPTTGSR